MRSAAGFQLVTQPWRSWPMIASNEFSTIEASWRAWSMSTPTPPCAWPPAREGSENLGMSSGGFAGVAGGPSLSAGGGGSPRGALARLRAHLAEDALEPRLRLAVDVGHRVPDGGVGLADQAVHLMRDGAIRRVALAAGAQLDQVHRLAR